MDVVILISQLILSLAILVLLHEFGHFLPAKLFKTRVEKFYLFFNPYFSLFKKKIGETEYGIGWLPLGGYVKIAGMIDESMDKEQMAKDPEPWEFRSKPAWQRLIIMIGGVTVNVLLGVFIYAMILFAYGDKYLAMKDVKDGFWVQSEMFEKQIGIQTGDKFVAIGDEDISNKNTRYFLENMMVAKEFTIERNGELVKLSVPENLPEQLMALRDSGEIPFMLRMPFYVGGTVEGSGAEAAGLQEKDLVTSLNGQSIKYYDQFVSGIEAIDTNVIQIEILRDGQTIKKTVHLDENKKMGVSFAFMGEEDLLNSGVYEATVIEYGLIGSFGAGWSKAINKLVVQAKGFAKILNPSTGAYKGLGGFKTFAGLFSPTWDWKNFWEQTAFISIILAFMNLLPIPALDGGHVMFLLYEMATGRKPNEKFMEYAQMAGMILLLSLVLFANIKDWI